MTTYPNPGSEGGEPEPLVPATQEDNLAEGDGWQPRWSADITTFTSTLPYRLAQLARGAKSWRRSAPAESDVIFVGSEALADDVMTAYPTGNAQTGVISEPLAPGEVTPSRRRRRRRRAAGRNPATLPTEAPDPESAELSAEATVLDKVRATLHISGQVQRPIEFFVIVATAVGAAAALVFLANGLGVLATLGLATFVLLLVAVGLWHALRDRRHR